MRYLSKWTEERQQVGEKNNPGLQGSRWYQPRTAVLLGNSFKFLWCPVSGGLSNIFGKQGDIAKILLDSYFIRVG